MHILHRKNFTSTKVQPYGHHGLAIMLRLLHGSV